MTTQKLRYPLNSNKSADEFAALLLDTAIEHGNAYLWCVKDELRVFDTEGTNIRVDGALLRMHVKNDRAQFLGRYTPAARGSDILSDVKFVLDELRNTQLKKLPFQMI